MRVKQPTRLYSTYTLISDDGRAPGNDVIEPGDITWVHVDTAMTAIAIKGRCSRWIAVREIHPRTVNASPPAIVEEVSADMVFHRILDRRWRIPESRARWFARFELGGMLAQEDVPEARRRGFEVLTGDDQERTNQLAVVVVAQGLFDERDDQHRADVSSDIVMLHQGQIGVVGLIPGCMVVVIRLHRVQVGQVIVDEIDGRQVVIQGLGGLNGG